MVKKTLKKIFIMKKKDRKKVPQSGDTTSDGDSESSDLSELCLSFESDVVKENDALEWRKEMFQLETIVSEANLDISQEENKVDVYQAEKKMRNEVQVEPENALEQGCFYLDNKDYESARKYLSLAKRKELYKLGPKHQKVARVSCLLGDALLGMYEISASSKEGEEYLDEAEANFEDALGVMSDGSDSEVSITRKKLGDVYFYQHDYLKALEMYNNSHSGVIDLVGEQNEMFHELVRKKGLVYWKLEKYDVAIQLLEKVIQSRNVESLDDHRTGYAEALHALGSSYDGIKESNNALTYYIKCLRVGTNNSLIKVDNLTEVFLEDNDCECVADSILQLAQILFEEKKYNLSGHCFKQATRYGQGSKNFEMSAQGLRGQADVFKKTRDVKKLMQCYKEMLKKLKEAGRSENVETADILYQIGKCNRKDGHLEQARKAFEKSIELKKKILCPSSTYCDCLNSLGETFYQMGRLDFALSNCDEAYRIAKSVENMKQEVVALNVLARTYAKKSQIDVASDKWKEALKLQKQYLGTDNLEVATSLLLFGSFNEENCRYDVALGCYKESFQIMQEKKGTHHKKTVVPLYKMGCMYVKRYDYVNANRCFDRVMSAKDKSLLKSSLENASTLHAIAFAKSMIDDEQTLQSAAKIFQQCITQLHDVIGTDNKRLIDVYLNFGAVCVKLRDFKKALSCFDQALKISESYNIKISRCQVAKGDFFAHNNKFQDARDQYQEALRHVADSQSEEAYSVRHKIGILHLKQQQFNEALKILDSLVGQRKSLLGNYHPEVAITIHDVGKVYEKKKKKEEAKKKYEEALSILVKKNLAQSHPYMRQVTESLEFIVRKDAWWEMKLDGFLGHTK